MPLYFFSRKISAERYAILFAVNGCHIGSQGFKQKKSNEENLLSFERKDTKQHLLCLFV